MRRTRQRIVRGAREDDPDYGIVLLIYDIGYQSRAVAKWMDFRAGTFEENGPTLWFTRGGAGLSGEMELAPPRGDSMVNAIPFRRATRFVYAQKINCMVPDGRVRMGSDVYSFSPGNHSYGCLDWSRAAFPYHVEWRWCTASGAVGGVPFGLNIDYGFGTESSKSMIFHDNVGHHLDKARYTFDRADPMEAWIFTDDDNRVDLMLKPVCIERGGMNYVVLRTSLQKAYGFFTVRVRLDNGRWIEIN